MLPKTRKHENTKTRIPVYTYSHNPVLIKRRAIIENKAWLVFINILTFIVYGVDKYKAKAGQWRIPEKTLLLLAVAGGSLGAWFGMQVFRHKTQHLKFKPGIPVIFMLQVGLMMWLRLQR